MNGARFSGVARRAALAIVTLSALAACGSSGDAPTTPVPRGLTFTSAPCSAGTVQLAVAQAARVDCGNGGTTVTFSGNGASYLIVAQFAAYGVADGLVPYRMDSGSTAAARA